MLLRLVPLLGTCCFFNNKKEKYIKTQKASILNTVGSSEKEKWITTSCPT